MPFVKYGRLLLFIISAFLSIGLIGISPSPYPDAQIDQADEVLVHFAPGTPAEKAKQIITNQGLIPVQRIAEIDLWVARSRPGKTFASIFTLQSVPEVAWVEPNGWVYATGITPNDNFYQTQQYSLPLIGLPEAWVFGNGEGMVVGVLDSGVMINHPDLAQSLWTNPLEIPNNGLDDDSNGYIDDVNGYNFVGDVDSPLIGDQNSHGTHVAGVIASQTNNGIGVAGVAGGAKLQVVKVLNSAGTGTYVDLIQGIVYAANNGAKILNFSLGGPNDGSNEIPLSLHAAIQYAQSKGCLMVASAGNETLPGVLFPAAFAEVLAVTSTDASGVPFFSRYGPEVDLNAPGVDIFSPSINGSYGNFSGTSAAAPHVSGVAALVWALQPTLTASEMMNLLESTAQDLFLSGWDPYTGAGRVDALNAVLTLLDPTITVVAQPVSIRSAVDQGVATARITDSTGAPVPDGLMVTFSGDAGLSLSPVSVLTTAGEASVNFTSSNPGIHEITARIGPSHAGTVQVEVKSWIIYFPILAK